MKFISPRREGVQAQRIFDLNKPKAKGWKEGESLVMQYKY